MRLGGPIKERAEGPAGWVEAVRREGYRAAYCPVGRDAGPDEIEAYAAAAKEADIVIAEVGAWSNPLSPDEPTRRAALDLCRRGLLLAERIGARCCVNIAGSRGRKWDGPDAADLTDETFGMIVDTVRGIVDAVKPSRTFYALETMPWMYPDSADSYLELLRAVDRKAFAVHFDPVNLVCSPQRYYGNGALIRDFARRLGPHIKSCHAKDVVLREKLTVHLDEVRPGLGGLDYGAYMEEIAKLDPDTPVMLEHLPDAQEYREAAAHVRRAAAAANVVLG
jgi:sugar phosphate isomerase/epimerase